MWSALRQRGLFLHQKLHDDAAYSGVIGPRGGADFRHGDAVVIAVKSRDRAPLQHDDIAFFQDIARIVDKVVHYITRLPTGGRDGALHIQIAEHQHAAGACRRTADMYPILRPEVEKQVTRDIDLILVDPEED